MIPMNRLKIFFYALFIVGFVVLIIIYLIIAIPSIAPNFQDLLKVGQDKILQFLPKIIIVMGIIIFTRLFINKTLKNIEKGLEKQGHKQDMLLFRAPYRFIVWFIVIILSLSIIFKNFASLITSLGLIGFGITFALQKPILNFVGWLTIISKKPYWIGDRINIGTVKGDVFDINIMYTSLSEFSFSGDEPAGRTITIPNEFVLTQAIINYTRGSPYIWDSIELNITYDSDWKKASEIVETSTIGIVGTTMQNNAERWKLHKHKFTILGKDIVDKPIIRIEMASDFLKIRCNYIVHSRKRGDTRSLIMNKILENISKSNVKIAYNKGFAP